MNLPTKKHEEYLEYMKNKCNKYNISLILKGSLAHGNAKPFSDIDLLLFGNIDEIILDDIISGYDKIVMTNHTENPKGICILNYENGISVDMDVRKTVLNDEINNNIILCNFGFKIADEIIRNVISSKFMPERPQWYKTIRLIHRCCIKYLCGKMKESQSLTTEVFNGVYSITEQKVVKSDSIENDMRNAINILNQNYNIDKSIIDLLECLFQEINHISSNYKKAGTI